MNNTDIQNTTGEELGRIAAELLQPKHDIIAGICRTCLKVEGDCGKDHCSTIDTTDWNEAHKWAGWANDNLNKDAFLDSLAEVWRYKAAKTGILFSAWIAIEATPEDFIKAVCLAAEREK